VLEHEFSDTSENPLRFYVGANGITPYSVDFDNLLITDYAKVQRDGFLNEGNATIISWGDGIGSGRNIGGLWTPTRTGLLSQITLHTTDVASAVTSSHIEIQEHDGTNPSGKRGSSSNDLSVTGAGDMVYPFSTPIAVTKGEVIWFILVDDAGGSGDVNVRTHEAGLIPNGGAGKNDTLASITDSIAEEIRFEAVIDTSAGEPTPDHDTLLLIHSDTSDASTTFVDSSPSGRTITVVGNTQHDTAQNKFGASSILFDGTGDTLTVPDSNDWALGNFTIEMWVKTSTANRDLMEQATASGAANTSFSMWISSSHLYATFSNGSAFTNLITSTSITDGAWHHIAVVRAGNSFAAYVDGTSEATASSSMVMNNVSSPVEIGFAFNTGAGSWFNGHMDEIRISRVARWDASFTPPSAPYP
jgi:hypothetical protein